MTDLAVRGAGSPPSDRGIKALTNVGLLFEAVEDTLDRSQGTPGLISLYGRPGTGKSSAAAYVTAKKRAVYIEMKSVWSVKYTLVQILEVMGIPPAHTVPEMLSQVCEELAKSRRPLIIDQADYLIDKGRGQLLMDIYEGSLSPVIIIGEERIPANLKRHNRTVHDRVLRWVPAQPASLEDVETLVRAYAPGTEITEDLQQAILTAADGLIRWVAVSLHNVLRVAKVQSWKRVDLATWGQRDLRTGADRPEVY